MTRYKTQIIIIAILVASLSFGAWAVSTNSTNQESALNDQPTNSVSLGRTEISYLAQPGITSLAQLKDNAKDVITTESEYGELVDSIEGHKGGTDGKYWSFYVNGEMAQVGADAYIQQEGDLIEWKFQKL